MSIFKKDTRCKVGDLVLYKRTNEVVIVVEHKMPKQVTISMSKATEAFQKNFRYYNFIKFANGETDKEILNYLHETDIQVTVSLDELELLPDNEIAKLLY